MENNMQRNHVLGEYAVRIKKDRTEPEALVNGPTVLTEAFENSDIDEFNIVLQGEPSGFTKS